VTAIARDDARVETRKQAIFWLALLRELRKQAVSWLCQSESDAALAYLDRILTAN